MVPLYYHGIEIKGESVLFLPSLLMLYCAILMIKDSGELLYHQIWCNLLRNISNTSNPCKKGTTHQTNCFGGLSFKKSRGTITHLHTWCQQDGLYAHRQFLRNIYFLRSLLQTQWYLSSTISPFNSVPRSVSFRKNISHIIF